MYFFQEVYFYSFLRSYSRHGANNPLILHLLSGSLSVIIIRFQSLALFAPLHSDFELGLMDGDTLEYYHYTYHDNHTYMVKAPAC
jgi:hypothetical protein